VTCVPFFDLKRQFRSLRDEILGAVIPVHLFGLCRAMDDILSNFRLDALQAAILLKKLPHLGEGSRCRGRDCDRTGCVDFLKITDD
jgi:dTDP-4-amino-4,6-dideoxygalactose transaminase